MNQGLVRFQVTGFGSIEGLEVHLGRLAVLIGANGSGKSNILGALGLAASLPEHSTQSYIGKKYGAASQLLHYGPKRTPSLGLELDFIVEGFEHRYAMGLAYSPGDELKFRMEEMHSTNLSSNVKDSYSGTMWGLESQVSSPGEVSDFDIELGMGCQAHLGLLLGQLRVFHFHDTSPESALRTTSRTIDDQKLSSNGGNLAAFLLRLSRSNGESEGKAWKRINRYVGMVAPSVKELCPTPMSGNGGIVRLDWIDDQGQRFGVSQLSDGTLRAIALITVLAQPHDLLPLFLAIDEPELGLHPAAIGVVAELARSISHHSQVLFATQSTTFLDHFRAEEVFVVARENGGTIAKKMSPEKLAVWLDEYSLSALFTKGVLGGRP